MNYYIWSRETFFGPSEDILAKTEEGKILGIPADPENTDYQAYLEWIAAGNTPDEWIPE